MTASDLLSDFTNPPATYRGKPFWAWNGLLRRDELLRQIHVLQRMGMGGFFMHSRTGLATEYLGKEWFELINACADEAERLGMEAWLYDEDRWPSGSAGGLVTQDPRFRMRYLRMDEVAPDRFAWSDEVLAAFVCRRQELAIHDVRRVPRGHAPKTDAGETVLVFSVHEQSCDSNYNGFTYVNTMNAEATARFIELTHERYARECGSRLGRSIPGIFTDEPHRGALMDPFGEGDVSARQAPWTDDLPDRFREAFGYDITDHLPDIFLQPEGRAVSPVKWNFVELLMRLFLERYAAPYADWCRRHGIKVTGHVLHEDSLAAQTSMCGSVMRYYEHMDVPGIDLLTEGNRAYWVAKQLQSAAAQLGRPRLLSELYGCTGWQMPFKGHKAVGDWQALFGINLRCQHLSWYTMEGEAKRDYPASIFHQSAWWPLYHHVEDYFSRLNVLLMQGERVCRLLVINPVESVWCQVHVGWCRFLNGVSEPIQELDRRYAELFHWLQGAQMDFDYADEAMLAQMGEVAADGKVRVGQTTYDAVLLGGMTTVRSTTLDLLQNAAGRNVPVIFAGDPPAYVDAEPSDRAADFSRKVVRTRWDRDAVVEACERALERVVAVTDGGGNPACDVFCHVRRDAEGRTIVMVLNTDRDHGVKAARIRVRAAGAVEQWDCLRGRRYAVPHEREGQWTVITADLEPAGERVYVIGPTAEDLPALPVGRHEAAREDIRGPFRYRLSEPNVCVLDRCEYRIGDGPSEGPLEVLKVDRAVRRRFGLEPRGGSMLQPWYAARSPRRVVGAVTVRFRFAIERMPESAVDLVVERPDVFAVTVNGTRIAVPEHPKRWVDICFARLPVPEGVLQLGENTVELSCDYAHDVGLEAVYLLGSFGVEVRGSGAALTSLPERLAVGDITRQGLPFYGGAIAYELELPQGASRPTKLAAPGMSAACAVVVPRSTPFPDTSSLALDEAADGTTPDRLIAWDPYEADIADLARDGTPLDLRVYLTRRNTFGPLHQVPLHAPAYGPGNWLTEGAAFSEAYVLLPSGLLHPPQTVSVEQ